MSALPEAPASIEPPRTDGGAYRIVARREFVERARDRGFLISSAITVAILVGLIVVNGLLGGGPSTFDLGAFGPGARGLAAEVARQAPRAGFRVHVVPLTSPTALREVVTSDQVDGAIGPGPRLVVKSSGPDELVALIRTVAAEQATRRALLEAGLSPEQVADALRPPPIPVVALEPPQPNRDANRAVAFVGVLLLYGQLIGYGYWVAAGVVEEKASRVVEVLLATIRPSQLLGGKVLGIGLLGLVQLVVIGVIVLGTASVVGVLDVPAAALATAALVLAWFVVGFAFYSTLFAAAGSLVSRQEDLQPALTPLTLLVLASFFVAIGALSNPTSTLARVASFLPPSAPLIMPTRIVLGDAAPWEVLVSVGITAASIALLIPLAARLYTGAILRPGKTGIREAWRARG